MIWYSPTFSSGERPSSAGGLAEVTSEEVSTGGSTRGPTCGDGGGDGDCDSGTGSEAGGGVLLRLGATRREERSTGELSPERSGCNVEALMLAPRNTRQMVRTAS